MYKVVFIFARFSYRRTDHKSQIASTSRACDKLLVQSTCTLKTSNVLGGCKYAILWVFVKSGLRFRRHKYLFKLGLESLDTPSAKHSSVICERKRNCLIRCIEIVYLYLEFERRQTGFYTE